MIDHSLDFGIQNFLFVKSDDTDLTYDYVAYMSHKGSILIVQYPKSGDSALYYLGAGEFDVIWSLRTTLTYGLPNTLKNPDVTEHYFKFQILTATPSETFALPLTNTGVYNFVVYWGDGTSNYITAFNDPNRIHTYVNAGTYTISMRGICTRFIFINSNLDGLKLTKILEFADMGFTILRFFGCENLTTIDSSMKNLKSLTTAYMMFCDCFILESIPEEIFDGSPAITNFNHTFSGCFALKSIPAHLFDKNINALTFEGVFFDCQAINTPIPEDLFKYNVNVTNLSWLFYNCYVLPDPIPQDLFKYNTQVTTIRGAFNTCRLITTIPVDLFRYNTLVTQAQSVFLGCLGITAIPIDIFRYNTLVTDFSWVFWGNVSITSLPVDLFRYNTLVTSFYQAFTWDIGLTEIPDNLFRYNTLVTTFYQTFQSCYNLTEIPTDLFRYNTLVTSFYQTFIDCSRITTIPIDLFRYNSLVNNFRATFRNCINAKYNINIFYATGEEGIRFLNKTVDFTNCFYRTTFSGIQGTAPDLWNCNFGTGTPTRTGCYGGAGNSLASLDNYALIPSNWK